MHRVGDKVGDGSEEGYYGDPPPGYNPFADVRRSSWREGTRDHYEFRWLTCFEIFTGKVFGCKPEYRYILAREWRTVREYTIISISKKCKTEEVRTDRNPQTFTLTNTISNLVNAYIHADAFGAGIQIGDKRIIPVRNMRSDDKDGLELGYVPLNEEEMAEFKRLLLARDPERYRLSFPEKGEEICRR